MWCFHIWMSSVMSQLEIIEGIIWSLIFLFVSTAIKTISCHYFILEFSIKRYMEDIWYAQCFHVIFMKEGGIIWAPGSVGEISGPTFLSLPSGEGCWFRSRQEEITEWKLPVESHSNFTPLLSLFNSLKRCSLNY